MEFFARMDLIFVACVVTFFCYFCFSFRRRYELACKLQGPKNMPLIGYTKLFTLPLSELFVHLIDLSKQFDRYYKVWVGGEIWMVVYCPKMAKKILNDVKLRKANDYEFLKVWLGKGLLVNEGKPWFTKRKALTPAFHFKILENFIDVFSQQADLFIEKIKRDSIKNFAPHLFLLAFFTTCETIMGIQMNAEIEENLKYIDADNNLSKITFKRIFNPLLANDWIFRLTKDYNIFQESLKFVNEINKKIILNRRNKINNEGNLNGRKKMALLDILLQTTIDGVPLSDQDVEDEVKTFMFAGHDTSGATLGFLLYALAKHQDIQARVAEEIFSVCDENNEYAVNITKLNNLKYLEMVIKETMRFYTTVPFIGRQILEEYDLEGVKLPANTNVSIFVYGMCHNENLFPEAEKFNPERFNQQTMNSFDYIPFSAGHRNCIGQKFAMYFMKSVVVRIVQKFNISLLDPDEKLILVAGIVMKTQNGINLKFEPR